MAATTDASLNFFPELLRKEVMSMGNLPITLMQGEYDCHMRSPRFGKKRHQRESSSRFPREDKSASHQGMCTELRSVETATKKLSMAQRISKS